MKSTLTTGLVAVATALGAGVPAVAQDKLVIEAGRVITRAGADIEDGVIVVQDGRITAVGPRAEVDVPWDAPVVGGPEYTAFPGFVEAHASRGIDRTNEGVDVAPFLSLRDSVDPVNFYFEDCLRWGITTINLQHASNCVVGARGMIVRPTGMTVEAMSVRPVHGMKISASPKSGKSAATQAQALRRAFSDLKRHLEDLVTAKQDAADFARREALYQGRELEETKPPGRAMKGSGWTVEGLELVPRDEIDAKLLPLLELIEGKHHAYFECRSAVQVHLALEIAQTNGFLGNTVFVLSGSSWKALEHIKGSGASVIWTGGMIARETDPLTGEESETFVLGKLAEMGIPFAITSQNQSTNSLWFQAAMAIGHGLDREQALAAVTTTPAKILGLESHVGSLEAGKDGNVVLFSGDPLSVTSWVEKVVIEGRQVYDREQDIRNRHLLEGEEPRGTRPGKATGTDEGGSNNEEEEESGN